MSKKILLLVVIAFVLIFFSEISSFAATVNLSWDVPEDGGPVIGYVVFWSTTSGNYSDDNSATVIGPTSYSVDALDESQEYYFIVKAYNSAGMGPASNEVSWPYSGNTTNSGGSGCFIATAAYGSPSEYHVKILREFRDTYLIHTRYGKKFVDLYYKYTPTLANFMSEHYIVRTIIRLALYLVVGVAYLALHISTKEKLTMILMIIILTSWSMFILKKYKKSRYNQNNCVKF